LENIFFLNSGSPFKAIIKRSNLVQVIVTEFNFEKNIVWDLEDQKEFIKKFFCVC